MRRGLLLIPLLCAGCLVPQDIEEMDPPRRGNDAPRIVLRTPAGTEVITQRGCQAVTFAVDQIEDFDAGDDVVVRWFVDWRPDDPTKAQEDVIPGSPQIVDGVRGGSQLRLDPDDYPLGTLLVEAVVSDGFDPHPDAEPANRAVLPGKDVDETSWQLTITAATECLQ